MLGFNTIYNFTTISNTVIDNMYKDMKVIGIGGLHQMIKTSGVFTDVTTVRQQLVAETGLTLVSAEDAMYYLFEDKNGNEVILADDWILPDTIMIVSAVTLKLEISDITTSDVSIILNLLRLKNYKNINIL